MVRMRLTIVLALMLFLFSTAGVVLAVTQDQIGQSRLEPSSPFYFLKTIRESWELKFAPTPRVKWLRQLEFATRRLREVKSLLVKNQELIAPTLEKYKSHIDSLPDKDLTDSEISTRIKESLAVHLEALQVIYHQASTSRAKMAIRATISRIVKRVDIPNYARIPACNFLAKEASSSALNQTEQAVYLERAKNCFGGLISARGL